MTIIDAARTAPRSLLQPAMVSPPRMFSFIIPSGSFECQSNIRQRSCEETRSSHRLCRLPLPRAAHEVEVAAFVGLQDRLVEKMRVAAFGPVRRCRRRERGATLLKL